MYKLLQQSLVFGLLFGLLIAFLECRRVAAEHYELYGRRELFLPLCGSKASHIVWLILVFIFWFGLSSMSYHAYWYKHLPLW